MPRNCQSSRPGNTEDEIETQAAAWVARHDRGLSPGELREFNRWVDKDARCMQAYRRIAQTWGNLEQTRLLADLNQLAERVQEDAAERQHAGHNRTRLWAIASIAAGLALAVVIGRTWHESVSPQLENATSGQPGYTVLESSAQRIILPDGSIAELNGESLIFTEYTETERKVKLLKGEVHFTVAKNPARPFVVAIDNVTVRAVGTAFNVKLQQNAVEVLVTEGKVSVDDKTRGASLLPQDQPVLSVGQKIVLSSKDATKTDFEVVLASLEPMEIERAMAWQTTRLVFDGTSLNQVVEAFNRYNTHKLLLGDQSLSSRTFTGVFKAQHVDAFVRLLEVGADITARHTAGGDVILESAQ